MDATPLTEQIDELINRLDGANYFGRPSARKGGRNDLWPWVPIIDFRDPDLPRGGYTTQIRGLAFLTRDEAIAAAEKHIERSKETMRANLHNPRYRALREQHGLPTIIPASTPGDPHSPDSHTV